MGVLHFTVVMLLFTISIVYADDLIIVDTNICKFSTIRDISTINAKKEIEKSKNKITFKVKADSNMSYNAECSKWSLEPMDSLRYETGGDYSGSIDCSKKIRMLFDDDASFNGMEIVDVIKETHGISLDSLYKLKFISILIRFC